MSENSKFSIRLIESSISIIDSSLISVSADRKPHMNVAEHQLQDICLLFYGLELCDNAAPKMSKVAREISFKPNACHQLSQCTRFTFVRDNLIVKSANLFLYSVQDVLLTAQRRKQMAFYLAVVCSITIPDI